MMRVAVTLRARDRRALHLESLRATLRNHRLVRRRPDHCRGNVWRTLTADPRSDLQGGARGPEIKGAVLE